MKIVGLQFCPLVSEVLGIEKDRMQSDVCKSYEMNAVHEMYTMRY